MTHTKRAALCALSAILGLTASAHAQDVTGSITGTVTDSTGAAIKGATVTLINTDRNHTERVLTTNAAGSYTATSLPAGTYTVKEAATGFKSEDVVGLVLHVNDNLTVNRSLKPGGENETVTIEADALQVSLQDATATGLITGTQARELVLSTRNFEQLLSLQPGVANTATADQIYIGPTAPVGVTTLSFSVNGQRTSANYWTIDGADNMDRGTNLTLLVYPSVDAISEFKTLRGVYSAEFGRTASGQVNVVTKNGTNQFHGDAYEFFRSDYLNANDWLNKNKAPGVAFDKRPPLRYHDFGYTIGGPVWIPKVFNGHDKTFFFFGQEFRRVIRYSQNTLLLPTADERRGVFPVDVCANVVAATGKCADAGTTTINTNTSAAAAAYLKDIYAGVPLPNPGSPTLDPHTYNYNARSVFNDRQEVVRIDQAVGRGSNVFYRYIHDTIPTQEPFGFGGGTGLPGVQTTATRSPGLQHLVHFTYVASPTTIVEGGFAYSTGAILSTPTGSGSLANSPDIHIPLPFPSYLGVVPNITFTGLTGLSQGGGYSDYSDNANYFADVKKTLGHHTFTAGATFNRYEKTENLQGGNVGTFTFTSSTTQLPTATAAICTGASQPDFCKYITTYQSFANFLSGTATGGFTQTGQPRIPDLHANSFEAYLQDDYKVTPRLTVNFGLRYSWFGAPSDTNGWLANFDANSYNPNNAPTVDSSGTLCITGQPCKAGYTPNPNYDPANGFIFVNPAKYGVTGHQAPYGNTVAAVDRNNLAPRFGFAFDVFGDGKTALRGGYGIAFDATLFGNYENATFYAQPALGGSSYSFTAFDNPAAGTVRVATTPPAPPTPIYTQATLFHTPYAQQYSLDLQQQITPTLLVDIGYYGAHDTHLIGYTDINALAPGTAAAAGLLPAGGFINSAQVTVVNQVRRYKGYAGMYSLQPIYNSNYNSLQVQVKKRFRGKSEITGNFSWQRNLSNGPTADRSSAPQDFTNIKAEYGRVAYDRNLFSTIDFVWDIPWFHDQKGLVGRVVGGWEVSGIVSLNSGLPTTVTASQNLATFYTGSNVSTGATPAGGATFADVAGLAISGSSPASLRPDQISNPNSNFTRSRYKWFNTAAFANPSAALGRPGTERRGSITMPGFNREDLGIFRNFRIVNNVVFQLRGEAFNVFNHTNYTTVQTAATSSNFGQVTAARETRILQIAGKVTF